MGKRMVPVEAVEASPGQVIPGQFSLQHLHMYDGVFTQYPSVAHLGHSSGCVQSVTT